MFNKQFVPFVAIALSLLSAPEQVLGRYRWLERDDKPVFLHPRRFDQQNPEVLTQLSSACDGAVCGTLAGQAVSTLLANADECSQQDMADQIIDAAQQFDNTTKANMISLAVQFRQAEKNTPPDFTKNPPTNRNSVFCQKAPANAELNGLVQAQDPANDPNVFFDPATQSSVTKGSQANTFPFGTSGSASSNSSSSVVGASALVIAVRANVDDAEDCDTSPVTVTVAATGNAAVDATGSCSVVTLTVGADATATAGSATATDSAAIASSTASASQIGNFGSCSIPQIEFGTGFDGRKETSFQPVNQTSYNHGSADAIDIITQFICDALTNTCGADQTAKNTCASAASAADAQPAKTGAQADAFNAVFGITTDFAAIPEVDDQGNVVAGSTGSSSVAASATDATGDSGATATASASGAANTADTTTTTSGNADIGNFGSCSVPEIEFGTGFDGRTETSFQPVDQTSYNHGSADAIDVITQFICDALTNTCGADQTAKDTCATAQSAADAQPAKSGAQADAFNAAFGITTDFASVPEVDDTGNVVAGTGSSSASDTAAGDAATPTTVATATAAATTPAATATASTAAAATGSGGNLQTFTGSLGAAAPAVSALSNGEFQVEGNDSFQTLQNALERSCDVQNNQCADAANSSGDQGDLTVAACNAQQQQCETQASSA